MIAYTTVAADVGVAEELIPVMGSVFEPDDVVVAMRSGERMRVREIDEGSITVDRGFFGYVAFAIAEGDELYRAGNLR